MDSLVVAGIVFACTFGGAILDLDQPFDGLIQIPTSPLRNILSQMGEPILIDRNPS